MDLFRSQSRESSDTRKLSVMTLPNLTPLYQTSPHPTPQPDPTVPDPASPHAPGLTVPHPEKTWPDPFSIPDLTYYPNIKAVSEPTNR